MSRPDFKTCKVCRRELHAACGAIVAGEFVCATCRIGGYGRVRRLHRQGARSAKAGSVGERRAS